uniref:Nitrate/nitrite transporter n=1 Tax=Ditylum brightwellii TaxID=49249 RepID=A0A7S4T1D1_9STRA
MRVKAEQDDRADEIKLCSFKRPHMRAFHFAWWCYHVAFLMWFSITPLLSEVQLTLQISKEQIWTSSISAVSGTIIMRFILGPFCDKYGPRIPMGIILFCSAVPTALTGLVQNATGLTVLRFFIGVGGSTFVMCQYWTSRMFTKEWAGTANATVGGWGNLGGGITQLLIGSVIFPLLKKVYDGSAEKAWRTACVVPATLGLITSICVIKFTDDCPKGNYSKMKKTNQMKDVSVSKSFRDGALNVNTWLLFVQYACCFGVEITMNNAAALYFKEQFLLTTESAAAIASIFGWMNLFARGCGGFISDYSNRKSGMRGRLLWQSICLLIEGTMVIIFAFSKNLATAIAVLVFFSIFVQAAEGSTYGIVPYVNPPITGSISGIVGAGGNTGAVAFGLCFRQLSAKMAFVAMGIMIVSSSVLSLVIFIPGQSSILGSREETIVEDKEIVDTSSDDEKGTDTASPDNSLEYDEEGLAAMQINNTRES